ncbi:MAG TPA: DCC1-like thiol-disulfide oxidoreductase family protein [Gemmatimonadaceae bacterium]|jgi:predicted DCC family thiol-disulfide oxidoreductase YuxK|nr:DCC1-like thiol-disulfide oxidoreductase family protein [Gemmatimonadaceae bacterium]
MRELTVLYDAGCELCCAASDWLAAQPTHIPVNLIAAGSDEARVRFPGLDHAATMGQLTAIGDEGEVYHDDKAWVVSLWATRQYRAWAAGLAAPGARRLTRGATSWIARHRAALGPVARVLRP